MTAIMRLRDARPELPMFNMPSGLELDLSSLNIVHKFGRNTAVGTTMVPITVSGVYMMPTAATELEILSASGDDASGGTGARQVTIQGLVAGWTEATTTVTMNGTTPVTISPSFLRVYRMYVSQSGTYASQSVLSHAGAITVRAKTGGSTWAQLSTIAAGKGIGQSLISAYTIPTGRVGYISSIQIGVDSGKTASIFLFRRDGADTVAAPYTGFRLVNTYDGVQGQLEVDPRTMIGPFVGPSDILFMGKVASTTASVSVNFEMLTFATQ